VKILDRYLLRSFAIPLVASLAAFLAVAIIVDLFERLDTFLDNRVAAPVILEYYAAKLQFLAALTLPVSCLIAVLFALGGMARRNELVAMAASGIGLHRILAPILAAGFAVSLAAMALTMEVVPRANEVATDILDHEIRGRPRMTGDQRVDLNYLGAGGRYYLMRVFDGSKNTMRDVVVQQFARGTLVRRIDARTATWNDDGTWIFRDGFLRTFHEDGRVDAEPFDERAFPELRETPRDFLRPIKEPNEMTLGELVEQTKRAHLSGGDVTRLLVETHRRIAFPFASFVVILLGAPLTGAIRRGGHAVGFAAALFVGFLYYVLLEVGGTFGLSGQLPASVAAWLPNVVFLGLGILGLVKTRK
jgi:lipopolysaccharide export system permease protein